MRPPRRRGTVDAPDCSYPRGMRILSGTFPVPAPLNRPGRRAPGTQRIRAGTVRRTAAAALLLAAGALLLGGTDDRREPVLVAAHDLRPGAALDDGDLTVTHVPRGGALPGTLRSPDQAIGSRLATTVGAGEAVTGAQLLSSRLPAALTGQPSARLVPVRPADPAVAGLLRPGDLVDVLDEDARVLAADAVVAVPGSGSEVPALLAMGETAAHRVAAAGLANPLTLVLH